MEIDECNVRASWRWSLLFSVLILNICLPNLVLSYGVLLIHSTDVGIPLWTGFITPTVVLLMHSLTQCWYREAADSWGGSVGYRVMAAFGLLLVVSSLLLCAFTPYYLHPYMYGALGGLGSSLVTAQIDAVVFDTYDDNRIGIIKGICLTGQAIGQALFPHIITALINSYGYKFSYIMLAGIILQTMPAIMFLKTDENFRQQNNFSRYSDLTYTIFNNDHRNNFYTTELQLNDLSGKCWKSPTDDNRLKASQIEEIYDVENDIDNESILPAITPPPSPEEKRRNIYGVEILPEIPEESEESDDDEELSLNNNMNKNKRRLSNAIKRLSILGDNFDDYISKKLRKDSLSAISRSSENCEFSEIEVTYDNIAPITEIEREKIFNSFSFRCQSAYASLRRRLWMPSYRIYRLRRRMQFLMYNINDTFIKPMTRSLSCWKFYPAMMLYFSKLSLTTITITLLPMIASQVHPKIMMSESNFLLSLHGFTWLCFLLSTPWLAYTPKRNFKYVATVGLMTSTAACFVLAWTDSHDSFSIGCVVAGLGYGAVTCCCETAAQDFLGARNWPKLNSALEIFTGTLLTGFVFGLSFIIDIEGGFQYSMFVLGITLFITSFVWLIIATFYIINKIKSLRFRGRWLI